MKDELLDIVDKNDIVIGQKLRSEIYLKRQNNIRALNIRAVNAFLINKDFRERTNYVVENLL